MCVCVHMYVYLSHRPYITFQMRRSIKKLTIIGMNPIAVFLCSARPLTACETEGDVVVCRSSPQHRTKTHLACRVRPVMKACSCSTQTSPDVFGCSRNNSNAISASSLTNVHTPQHRCPCFQPEVCVPARSTRLYKR